MLDVVALEKYYQTLTDGELLDLRAEGGFTAEAEQVLGKELLRRKIERGDVKKYLAASARNKIRHEVVELKSQPRHAILWALVFAAVSAIALWIVAGNNWNLQDNPIASRIAIGYFFFICAGPYWMLYDSWHHERKLTHKMWFFFVPGGFLWYYFEVYRPRSRARKRDDQHNFHDPRY